MEERKDTPSSIPTCLIAVDEYMVSTKQCDPIDRLAALMFGIRQLEDVLRNGRTDEQMNRLLADAKERAALFEATQAEGTVLDQAKR